MRTTNPNLRTGTIWERNWHAYNDTISFPEYASTSYPGSFHYAPRWRKDPGPGWSRVSQILGDNNWDLWGVGKANVAFELKTIQGV